ncbi:MAG: MBL fold metallo-hydrolase [Dehalococcoidia bacterium]|jgi:hypothetical protein|nr:MBL fold metallo-hydrolase [Dehalococcoidia bacterium]MDP6229031.1 MBL fold metallo-hydrolase [Dehalococcoidia bacterium]MDP7084221.1 MBL fold metallo-hydrolase [Dehalococcoidia bacterium]MDP7511209.1 MBL fold metallo-hydrolase [Dehalococcoidia bacterium]
MELRVLGAHNMESKHTRMESHLIDGVLALDAGSITRALSFDEQLGIRAIILSHRHFDHVRDLPAIGLALRNTGVTVDVYAIPDTIEFVAAKLLDGSLFPDPLNFPSPENPTLRLHPVQFYQEFKVLDYTATAVPVPHSVPAAGFQIASGDVSLFYTGDTGRGLCEAWKHVTPTTLLAEVTFGNENEAWALEVGHLTPNLLEEALVSFNEERGYLPKVIVAHMSPPWEVQVKGELRRLARKLGVDLQISRADMRVTLQPDRLRLKTVTWSDGTPPQPLSSPSRGRYLRRCRRPRPLRRHPPADRRRMGKRLPGGRMPAP